MKSLGYATLVALSALCTVMLVSRSPDRRPQRAGVQQSAQTGERDLVRRETPRVNSPQDASKNYVIHEHVEDAPPWTVGYGTEFWRSRHSPATNTTTSPTGSGSLDINRIVDRVSHAFDNEDGVATAKDRAFQVRLNDHGLSVSVKMPPQQSGDVHVTFQTREIRVGDVPLYEAGDANEAWSVTGNTAQRPLNANKSLLEHYDVNRAGAEVTWVLKERPPVAGSLTIQSELTGVSYLGRGVDGLEFGQQNIAQLRVSDVTVVDSTGQRTKLPLQASANQLKVEVPADLLASSEFPIAIDPTIGPSFSLTQNTQTNGQFWPAVASNGTNYLVVWTDTRVSSTESIYGARVSSGGTVLDPSGIAICTSNANTPRVASCQGNYLVVWHDGRNYSTTEEDIYGARVAWNGSVLDSNGFAVCNYAEDQNYPDVTANGTNYFVVWSDGRFYNGGATAIYGTRIGTNATVLDGNGFQIYYHTYNAKADFPRVACDGLDFMVVCWDRLIGNNSVWGIAVNSSGTVVGSEFVIGSNATHPLIAWSTVATNYLVVYNQSPKVYGNRLSKTGSVLDGAGFGITTNASTIPFSRALACNGTNYLVLVEDGWPFNGFSIRATDAAMQSFRLVPYLDGAAGAASMGTQFLVVYDADGNGADYDDGDFNVYGVLLNDTVQTAFFPISTDGSGSGKSGPSVAATESRYCIVWSDTRNDSGDIYATVVTESGLVQTPKGIPVCVTNGAQDGPVIAATANHFFAIWVDSRNSNDIFGARMVHVGNGVRVEDTNGFAVLSAPVIQEPTVGGSGTNYLVTCLVSGSGLKGVRVTTTKTILDNPPISVAPSASSLIGSSIASIGTNWLVTWNQVSPDYNIYANRVTSTGNVLDGSGFAVCTNAGAQEQPRVAANGTNYLIVWNDDRTGNYDLYGTRVDPNGNVLDGAGFPICNHASTQAYMAVASDGADFFVVWSDTRGGTTAWNGGTYGTRVEADGTVPDTSGFNIDSGITELIRRPTVASARRNAYLACYFSDTDLEARFILMQRMQAVSLSSSTFSMRIIGGGYGTAVLVESSPDLATWSPFSQVTVSGTDSVDFSDTTVSGVSSRFYRARTAQGRADTAIGFYRVVVPGRNGSGNGGIELVANQLDNPAGNSIPVLFDGVPSNTRVISLTTNGILVTNLFNGSVWTTPSTTLPVGSAMFVQSPSTNAITNSFWGTIRQGALALSAPVGYSLAASPIPEATDMVRMEFPAIDFEETYEWNPVSQNYANWIFYYEGTWYDGAVNPDPGSFAIGDGFLLQTYEAKNWVRNFSVW